MNRCVVHLELILEEMYLFILKKNKESLPKSLNLFIALTRYILMLTYYGIVDPFYTTSIDTQVTVAKPKSFSTKNNGYANLEFVIKTLYIISVILGASQKVVAKTVS